MRKLILLAGAAAMAAAMPAFAKPDHAGHGKGHAGHGKSHAGAKVKVKPAKAGVRTDVRARTGIAVGANGCPPGLAKKGNGCLPPGQARKLFNVGQRLPVGYNFYSDYDDIPLVYRDRYGIPTGQQYIYRDRTVYVVDPATRLVTSIIDLLD